MESPKPGNRLYHYCKLETAIKHILPKLQLRLGPLLKTNDPRENKTYHFSQSFSVNEKHGTLEEADKWVSDYLREDTKVICFCDDNRDHFGYGLSRMWAHYGDRHQGVCIELDKSAFSNENIDRVNPDILRKIIYQPFSFEGMEDGIDIDFRMMERMGKEAYLREKFREEHFDHLYITKDNEWESENEIRQVCFSDNTNDEFCSIQASIRTIYLGLDFDMKHLPTLKAICPKVNIFGLGYYKGKVHTTEFHEAMA